MARKKSGSAWIGVLFLLGIVGWFFNALAALIEPLWHWEIPAFIAGVLVVGCLVFAFTHLDRLSESEVIQLASKRRKKQVRQYFTFDAGQTTVSTEFKAQMAPRGTFYPISCSLHDFPSVAAALLKYKKHEWIILAFERAKEIGMVWVNKGPDRTRVMLELPVYQVIEKAIQGRYTSILAFHNHPNIDPRHYNCLLASPTDLETARQWALALNESGLTHLAMVCERGRFSEYWLSPADCFLNGSGFVAAISQGNGRSRLANLRLHLERIF